jgi:hypothetical protein
MGITRSVLVMTNHIQNLKLKNQSEIFHETDIVPKNVEVSRIVFIAFWNCYSCCNQSCNDVDLSPGLCILRRV